MVNLKCINHDSKSINYDSISCNPLQTKGLHLHFLYNAYTIFILFKKLQSDFHGQCFTNKPYFFYLSRRQKKSDLTKKSDL